jgi:hypothetical protein
VKYPETIVVMGILSNFWLLLFPEILFNSIYSRYVQWSRGIESTMLSFNKFLYGMRKPENSGISEIGFYFE